MNAIDPVISHILRGLLALVFAAAAYHKLSGLRAFRDTLANYQLVPEILLWPMTAAIVAIESAVTVSLLWPAASTAAPTVAACVLAIYAVAIAINLLRGRSSIDCGCSGPAVRQSLSAGLIVRNITLVVCCWLITLDTVARPLAGLDAGTVLFGMVGLFLIYMTSNRLLAGSVQLRELISHDQ